MLFTEVTYFIAL